MRILKNLKRANKKISALLLLVLIIPLSVIFSSQQQTLRQHAATSSVIVTIDLSSPTTKSNFSPGISQIDNTLNYPFGNNNQIAVNNGITLIHNGIPFMNQFIMAWGTGDPWPDPTTSDPTNWSNLDRQMKVVESTGATPIISLAVAPWWMKGHLNADGSTTLVPDVNGEFHSFTYANGFTDYRGMKYPPGFTSLSDPTGSARVLDNQMPKWLHLVDSVARRYMVAPYNVRYFQVWNELKGYYNPTLNHWDYTTSAGDPSGYNAKHGYTYFYNQTYNQLRTTAQSLGIAPNTVQIGGPYKGIATWGATSAGGFPTTETALKNKAYGTYDQRDLDVIKYWLQHKVGAQFITFDGNTLNKDSLVLTDSFTKSEKYADIVTWIRSLDNTTYPGAQTLPIVLAEWYSSPLSNPTDDYNNAVKAYTIEKFIKAGGARAQEWGGEGEATNSTGLWTPTDQSGGGQALPWYTSVKAFRDYFGPGTQLYKTTISDTSKVDALASLSKTMLINKTANPLSVTINNNTLTLNPYQVTIISTQTVTPVPTTKSTPVPTGPPTNTPIPGDTLIHLLVGLHGIGTGGDSVNPHSQGNSKPLRPSRIITIEIFDVRNTLVATKQGTIIYNASTGKFEGSVDVGASFVTSKYVVKVKTEQYLKALVPGIQTITARQTNTLPLVTLIAGDVNDDNVLNIIDYNLLIGCYSDLLPPKNCPTGQNILSDLNDDGHVNQFDYNLFIRELSNINGQ